MKKFKLIRSNLYAEKQNYISTLKIENDDYYVAFNYFCDYMGDLKNNELDMQNLAVVVKMKVNGDGMPMIYSSTEDDIFINLCRYPNNLFDDEGIEKMICRLQKARETKKQLLRYVQMIARGEYIDVEKEFS